MQIDDLNRNHLNDCACFQCSHLKLTTKDFIFKVGERVYDCNGKIHTILALAKFNNVHNRYLVDGVNTIEDIDSIYDIVDSTSNFENYKSDAFCEYQLLYKHK